MNCCFYSSLCE